MMEILNAAHNIVSVTPELLSERHMKGTGIYYMDTKDMIAVVGWGENTKRIGEMIADYLELSLEGQQAAEEFALSSGDDSVVRLNEFEYMPDSHLLLIYLIWLCKFVGMNSSSPLRPAAGYGKIEKRKARDARLTQITNV